MTTVFVTAIGGDVAQGVARVIREARPDWRLVGTDIGERHAGTHFVDRFLIAPPASDPAYLDWLASRLAEEGASFCIPMNEAEIALVAALPEPFLSGAQLVTAGALAVTVAGDKVKTAHFIERIGLPAPWVAERTEDIPPGSFPCIGKPRGGAGSRSVYVCANIAEAQSVAQRHAGMMFQELLLPHDAEVTVAVFRDHAGNTALLQLQRRLVGGATAWAEVIEDPAVSEQCRRIAEALELHGAVNVQLRLTPRGPRVFEINARFSSTALMRHRLGFSDVIWTLDDLAGRTVTTTAPTPGQRIARIHDAVVLPPVILERKT